MALGGRRRFLSVLAGSATFGSCSGEGGEGQGEPNGPMPAGKATALELGALRFLAGSPLILGRDAGGIYAMTAICTHQQCNMQENGRIDGEVIRCGCHGATFDRTGRPTGGPARDDLRHYRVEISMAGDLTVQAGDRVPADTRLAV